jgi:hypothetical protein
MVAINIPSLLALGFIIAILLIYYGRGKGTSNPSYFSLIGSGIILLGIMVVMVPLSWYGTLTLVRPGFDILFSDILILTCLSTLGGILIGYGIIFYQRQPAVSGW